MAGGGGPSGGGGGGGGVNQGKFDGTGSTTAAFVALFTNTNTNGAIGIGTLKNTDGANTLSVRETVIDAFGNTTVGPVLDLAPGDTYLLDPQTNFQGGGLPYYTSYKVEVEDKIASSHATYEVHYSGIGTVA